MCLGGGEMGEKLRKFMVGKDWKTFAGSVIKMYL